MTTNTPELKPCPFCNFIAYPEITVLDNSVRCVGCGAKIVCLNDNNCAITKPSSIEKWNHRAGETTWQPISSAPEKTGVIVCGWKGFVGEAVLSDDGWWWAGEHWTDAHSDQIYPTHWMPLPLPPTGEKK